MFPPNYLNAAVYHLPFVALNELQTTTFLSSIYFTIPFPSLDDSRIQRSISNRHPQSRLTLKRQHTDSQRKSARDCNEATHYRQLYAPHEQRYTHLRRNTFHTSTKRIDALAFEDSTEWQPWGSSRRAPSKISNIDLTLISQSWKTHPTVETNSKTIQWKAR